MTWLKDLNEFFKERLSNPFFFTFVFFWIIWNWQGVAYFIYSNDDILFRLGCINDTFVDINRNIIYPGVLAISTIILSNGFFLLVEFLPDKLILLRKKRLYNRLKLQFDEKQKVAEAEFNYNLKKNNAKTVEELNNEITHLKKTIELNEKEFETIRNDNNTLRLELNKITDSENELKKEFKSVQTQLMNERIIINNIKDLLKEWIDLYNIDDDQQQSKTFFLEDYINSDLLKVLFKNNQFKGERTKNLKEFLSRFDNNFVNDEQNYILISIINKYLELMEK
ncbi:hypothetical protein [Belliella pelovolcani]|uniref:Uncharacterized protein n=1 Tax=Belliella pelovolcani TaxID=529505 RepID=A0A1N7MRM9_9BACT|nr:hypothetical protein [Belliella pelovolcani]SIS88499.1 hypothetical protein SAMN05421761_10752 [Belliella pelovolcani]